MRDDQIIAQARVAFMEESRDLLTQLESALLALTDAPEPDSINAAFRAAHTIKGSAGLFGLTAVVGFTHHVEALLERVRAGELVINDAIVAVLLQCRDHIERLLGAEHGDEADADRVAALQPDSQRLVAELSRAAGQPDPVVPPTTDTPALAPGAAAAAADAGPDAPVCARDDWLLHLRFGPDTFAMGFDPLSFLRYLPTVGEVVGAQALLDAVPALDDLDPEQCHLGTVLRLESAADKRSIESVFDFVADSITLEMLPPSRNLAQMRELLAQHADDATRLGELLLRIGAITPRELDLALQAQHAGTAPNAPHPAPVLRLGEQMVALGVAPPEMVQAAVVRQGQLRDQSRDKKVEESRFVRVAADKLDALIALIGELVIAGSASQILAARRGDAEFGEAAARVCGLVEGARDRALQLRMVPIGETFARFKRIAHEVGRTLGKEVELAITGGDAELDKSMVDQIVDPLTHLVRNALDHGLETPAQRLAAGKPARGNLALNAYHESGSIVIEVSDDGRGLSRERILAKAIERELVSAGVAMSDAEVHQLIFLPGFSTADSVTDLSGRGVGMDVVRRNIQALRGEVSLASTPGAGSTVQIRLPLTLAIIDGFRFEVAEQSFVVPLDGVVECIETPPEAALPGQRASSHQDQHFHLRGEVVPLLCLRQVLGLHGAPAVQRSVVVMRSAGRKVGVLVDRLLGEHQTVIKPLGRLFRRLRGISGSTILGTGSVALILDIPALVSLADAGAAASLRRPATVTDAHPHLQSHRRPVPANPA